MTTVTEVSIKKKGTNEKTGKPWTMYNVATEDGSISSGFQLVKVGDSVELEQKGEFLNYHPVKNIDKDWPEAKRFHNSPEIHPESPQTRSALDKLDRRQLAIIRQHSQSMAIEVLKLKVTLNELTVDDLTPAKLRKLSDYFDNDVLGEK